MFTETKKRIYTRSKDFACVACTVCCGPGAEILAQIVKKHESWEKASTLFRVT